MDDTLTVKGRLIAVLVGLAFTVFAGEVSFRLMLDEVNYLKPKVQPHPFLGHVIVPGTGGHDDWGFRNNQVPKAAEIVAIGDSATYGIAATSEESWPSWLRRISGRSVYNLGMSGYGPPDYKYLLLKYGISLSPKIVIFGVYLGNDLQRSYEYAKGLPPQSVVFDNQKRRETYFRSYRTWLSRHSLLYQVTKWELPRIFDSLRHWESTHIVGLPEDVLPLNVPAVQTMFNPRKRLFDLTQGNEQRYRIGLQTTFEIFDEIQDICNSRGMKCVFLLIPTKESVYWQFAKTGLTGRGRRLVAAVVRQEQLVLQLTTQYFKENDFEYVDALPAMRAAAVERPLYPPSTDVHPTGVGYRVIAANVLKKIRSASPFLEK